MFSGAVLSAENKLFFRAEQLLRLMAAVVIRPIHN